MKSMLIYERPVGLHRERHRDLRVAPSAQRYAFARDTNSVLLAASELPQAGLDYPCVFVRTDDGPAMAALLGLRDRENLFVDAAGDWQSGSYVPAFIRRYPFVLAQTPLAQDYTVCIDESYPGLNRVDGEPLFDADGCDSPWLGQAKQFLIQFRQEMEASRAFTQRLAELGLLVERAVDYPLSGRSASLSGLLVVDEHRLLALSAQELEALFRPGWLGLVYAHLGSLGLLPKLARRLSLRLGQAAAAPQLH